MNKIKERRAKIEEFLKKRNEQYTIEEIVEAAQEFLYKMKEIGETYFPLAPQDWDEESERY